MFNLIIREICFRFVGDTDLFTKIQKGLKKGETKKWPLRILRSLQCFYEYFCCRLPVPVPNS